MRVLPFFLLAAAALNAAGCDDDPGFPTSELVADSLTLYSLSRPELLGLPSAFDFGRLFAVRVEAPGETGSWDFALGERNGEFVLLPPAAVIGGRRQGSVGEVTGTTYDALTEAPRDTAIYKDSTAVPLRVGGVYVIRSRPIPCIRFAKLSPVRSDPARGSVRFAFLFNPNCNDRDFVKEEN